MLELSRKSKNFVDISLAFEPNPVTGDITTLRDVRAINNSVKNCVMVAPKESPFTPNFGSDVYNLLFELNDGSLQPVLEQEIRRTIAFNEPRVDLQNVIVRSMTDQNAVSVRVEYKIIGMQDIFTFDQILRPTR